MTREAMEVSYPGTGPGSPGSTRKQRRWTFAAGISTAVTLVLAGCGAANATSSSKPSSVAGPTLILKFSDLQNVHTATTDSALEFAALVKKYTGGKITIQVYPNSELGTVPAQLAGTEAGTIAFYATPDLSAAVPQSNVLGMPYLFPLTTAASHVAFPFASSSGIGLCPIFPLT